MLIQLCNLSTQLDNVRIASMRTLSLFFWLGLLPLAALSQTRGGSPFLDYYDAKTYQAHTQNWAVEQDSLGIIYIGNNYGVLAYDGVRWTLLPVNSIVRSMTKDAQGRIYVGAQDDLGYLAPDSLGKLQFVSLLPEIPEEYYGFADVWKTISTPEGVFFQSSYNLFRWKDGEMTVWKAPQRFHVSFWVENQLYLKDLSKGLMRLEDDSLQLAPGGEFYLDKAVFGMIPQADGRILMANYRTGLWHYHPTKGEFTPHPTTIDTFLVNTGVYHTAVVAHEGEQFLTIATLYGGVAILRFDGSLHSWITENEGLFSNRVKYAYYDQQKSLWLALNNGIAKAEPFSPLRNWGKTKGLTNKVYSVFRHENTLYVGAANGGFYQSNDNFVPIEPLNGLQVWDWASINGQLLVGAQGGLFSVNPNNKAVSLLHEDRHVFVMEPSQKYPNRVYLGLETGLAYLERNNGTWGKVTQLDSLKGEVRAIFETKEGDVWVSTQFSGTKRIQYPIEPTTESLIFSYDSTHLYPNENLAYFADFGGQPAFLTSEGIYQYHPEKNQFSPYPLPEHFSSLGVRQAVQLGDYMWAVTVRDGVGFHLEQWNNRNGVPFHRDTLNLMRLPQMEFIGLFAEDSVVWVAGSEGLFQYQTEAAPTLYQTPFRAAVRRVLMDQDTLFFGHSSAAFQPPTLPYGINPLVFHFGTSQMIDEANNQYSYRLLGDDETWAAWTPESSTKYTNLWEGTYTFQVKAKNAMNQESTVASFSFKIIPPWYRTLGAYIGYGVVALLLVWGIVKANTYRLQQQNLHLEHLVKERTAEIQQQKEEITTQAESLKLANAEISAKNTELEQQKEEIASQADNLKQANEQILAYNNELETKNRDITASIQYAKRIQEAILPFHERLTQYFTDHFIFYKPKDIVSGDFYWVQQKRGKTIVAVGDCTGHGVPGAFMSMIGHALLNQIVLDRGITETHLILKELQIGINLALKQDRSENRDGMDIGLCTIDPEAKTLQFSGAINPCTLVQNGELTHIKGDRITIGGRFNRIHKKEFQQTTLSIAQPTTFYLYTDGIQDQFGGKENRKFMANRLRHCLHELHTKPMEQQSQALDELLTQWMEEGNEPQIDDMLLVGIYLDFS